MDPNATFSALVTAMEQVDHEAITDHCDALIGWTERGGFLPECWESSADDLLTALRGIRSNARKAIANAN